MFLSEKREHNSLIDQIAFHLPLMVGSGPLLYYTFISPPTPRPSSLLLSFKHPQPICSHSLLLAFWPESSSCAVHG